MEPIKNLQIHTNESVFGTPKKDAILFRFIDLCMKVLMTIYLDGGA
jgi:hypothetical protein